MTTEPNDIFRVLSEDEINDIMSCLEQFANSSNNNIPNDNSFYVISVWFYDVANKYFNSNTKPNSYFIITKQEQNYTQANTLNIAKNIWNAGLVPIEIIQNSGAYFYALPKFFIETPMFMRTTCILPAEYSVPKMEYFYHYS